MSLNKRSIFKCASVVVLGCALVITAGCQYQKSSNDSTQAPTLVPSEPCEHGNIVIEQDFESGQFGECRVDAKGNFYLNIVPEATPINPSPWYAFKVANPDAENINVQLHFSGYWYRYWPKFSRDKHSWQSLSREQVIANDEQKTLTLNLAEQGDFYIAAQPIVDNQHYQQWVNKISALSDLSASQFGQSDGGRALLALQTSVDDSKANIVILGRQHPPEVTGAMALFTFVETLMANDALAQDFREHFNLLILPNLNPDGVAQGYWRLNNNFTDLNRDWGAFNEPEIQHANAAIEKFLGENPLMSMLDFHSTKKNILYTQKDGQSRFPQFANNWHQAINQELREQNQDITMARKGSHNPKLNTAKRYFYERYDIPAITVELDDVNNQSEAESLGRVIARTYMQQLLELRTQ
ncbi:M14 family metallopeptidase [Thalassotalea mangrovi]|uniref:Peptidase M14 domain-containing protein n=1 Tax=Thalassotalea mangrovi TaxID=2572245 RepID=A0A4U1B6V6_9GAMM|nr:M14 family metallopeptidase [Thalassotalea mangrovi]TKB45592.1 hypothetical protein E8M12_08325 [Thalassotalea mangrovi]